MIPTSSVRIMVFGTFDVLHKGHEHFFKQARRLAKNPYLIVSVARDVNVKRIKSQESFHNEKQRLRMVQRSALVDKAILGGIKNHLPHILKEKPQVIALGYDQNAYIRGLKTSLKAFGLPVTIKRLKAHKPHIYKSSLIKKSKKYDGVTTKSARA
jgi:FAD synthetase